MEAPTTPRGPSDTRERRVAWLVFAGIAFLYLVPFPYFERLNSPNENARIYMVKAAVEHGTLAVDPVLGSGRPPIVDLARHDGRLYSIKAPGPSLLGIPFYWVATRIAPLSPAGETRLLRLAASTVPALILLPFLFRFLRRVSPDAGLRLLVFLGLAVGSMYFTHALLLAGHETAAVALCGSFLCAHANRRRAGDSPALLAAAGFLCAFAVASEYQAFPAGAAVGLYGLTAAKRKRHAAWVVLGALPPAILTGVVHQACYGSPFRTGHHFPAEPAFQQYQTCGWRGLFCFSWAGVHGTFTSPANGLFFYAPWLAFALPGFAFLFARRDLRAEAWCLAAVVLSYFVTIAGMFAWKGGWSVGPRYLGATMPFLAIAALAGLDGIHRRFPGVLWVFLPAWLVGVTTYGLSSAAFPHFPEDLRNPFFEFLMPLLRRGLVPRNLGSDLGLPAAWFAAPYLAVLWALGAVGLWAGLARVPRGRAIGRGVGVAVLAVGLLLAMSRAPSSPPGVVARDLALAGRVWEPPPDRR